jgi:hypothetical protein
MYQESGDQGCQVNNSRWSYTIKAHDVLTCLPVLALAGARRAQLYELMCIQATYHLGCFAFGCTF